MAKAASHRRSSVKKGVLKNFVNFTEKNTCVEVSFYNFIKKRLQHRCFAVKFAKFLRTLILKNICIRLLVKWLSAWLLTVKVIKGKGRPKFLQISKKRKSETPLVHKNKT